MEAKNMLLNNQWITEEIKVEIKKIPGDNWKWKHNDPKSMGHSKSSSKKEVNSDTSLPKETRRVSNNLTLNIKLLEKEQTKPNLVEGRK